MTTRWFEDYEPGEVREYGPVSVDAAEIVEFARRYDPLPFHTGPAAAAAGPSGGLIASGWHTVALMISLFATEHLTPSSVLPSPGADEIRWLRPVRPGQPLMLRTTVEQARQSRSKPDRGLVRTRLELVEQSGEVACRLSVTNLILRRPPA